MMLQVLSHTPLWVFALFSGLLLVGLLQTRTRRIKAWLAYAFPAGMMALSLAGVHSSFGLQLPPAIAWLAGAGMVGLIGYRLIPVTRFAYDARQREFVVPGSWTPLMVIMAIFFTKYTYAAMQGIGVAGSGGPATAATLGLVYGGFSGYFGSRAARLVASRCHSRRAVAARSCDQVGPSLPQ